MFHKPDFGMQTLKGIVLNIKFLSFLMGFPALESCLLLFKRHQRKTMLRLGLLNLKKKEDKMGTQGH